MKPCPTHCVTRTLKDGQKEILGLLAKPMSTLDFIVLAVEHAPYPFQQQTFQEAKDCSIDHIGNFHPSGCCETLNAISFLSDFFANGV